MILLNRVILVGSFLERVGRGRVGHSVARMILQMWRQSDYDYGNWDKKGRSLKK